MCVYEYMYKQISYIAIIVSYLYIIYILHVSLKWEAYSSIPWVARITTHEFEARGLTHPEAVRKRNDRGPHFSTIATEAMVHCR